MADRQVAPCGSWKSPIDAGRIAEGSITLREVRLDGEDVWWIEHRPTEGGRYAVVRRGPDGAIADAIPPDFSARTRVHEYGGGSYLPRGGSVGFVNFADQRFYLLGGEGPPEPVTPADALRYADFDCDRTRHRLVAVREDHRGAGEPVNTIVAVRPHDGAGTVLVEGGDFYSSPRVSPDGSQLAWLTWNHPDMPWDAAELRV
ncbi:MAG: S9 family peptidase, partial [Phycisphaerae bacterium]